MYFKLIFQSLMQMMNNQSLNSKKGSDHFDFKTRKNFKHLIKDCFCYLYWPFNLDNHA